MSAYTPTEKTVRDAYVRAETQPEFSEEGERLAGVHSTAGSPLTGRRSAPKLSGRPPPGCGATTTTPTRRPTTWRLSPPGRLGHPMSADHLSTEDLAELERLLEKKPLGRWEPEPEVARIISHGPLSGYEVAALVNDSDAALIVAAVNALPRLLAMIKEQGEVLERVGARWCMCSRADRMNDRAQPHCPYHGEPRHWQQRAEQAEAEVERLRAGRCQHGIPIGDLCDGISKRDEELERLRAALDRVEKLAMDWRRMGAPDAAQTLLHTLGKHDAALAGDEWPLLEDSVSSQQRVIRELSEERRRLNGDKR